MTGGLSLLDTQIDGSRLAFDALQGTKDTWVIADAPVKSVSLLDPKKSLSHFAVLDGELPSRVAENLFWMGRNAERCETSVQLLRSVFQTLEEESTNNDSSDALSVSSVFSAILKATTRTTGTLPGFVGRGGTRRTRAPQRELLSLLHEPGRMGTLPNVLNALQHSASSARDRISDELLRVFNQLDDACTELVQHPTPIDMFDNIDTLRDNNDMLNNTLMLLSTFAGLAHENFTHDDGWRFMILGRRLERVQHTCTVLETMMFQAIADLKDHDYPFDKQWLDAFWEFRFPVLGTRQIDDITLELRAAIEPWHVLGEEASVGGMAGYVDSSMERLQLKVTGYKDTRYKITRNGYVLPLRAAHLAGEYVVGVRYRAWQPTFALHPDIPVDTPLVLDVIDTWSNRSLGGCAYHVSDPGGRGYNDVPVNANLAESRRLARFDENHHTPAATVRKPIIATGAEFKVTEPMSQVVTHGTIDINPEYPCTADLRTRAPVAPN